MNVTEDKFKDRQLHKEGHLQMVSAEQREYALHFCGDASLQTARTAYLSLDGQAVSKRTSSMCQQRQPAPAPRRPGWRCRHC